ncbi:type II toxin-antitoxin system RelE/ParE family toxin [Candidatus Woesearchaeota archaeon]|nr:type II toxin-antitoxin system RelE/ParE family toxin [Candidatus Woesearchaeota archaeon]
MFSIELKKSALKFLKVLKVKDDLYRISNKIDQLQINPFPTDSKRVEGNFEFKIFRIRVGNYRILYYIDYNNSKVYIEKIDKRENVY